MLRNFEGKVDSAAHRGQNSDQQLRDWIFKSIENSQLQQEIEEETKVLRNHSLDVMLANISLVSIK